MRPSQRQHPGLVYNTRRAGEFVSADGDDEAAAASAARARGSRRTGTTADDADGDRARRAGGDAPRARVVDADAVHAPPTAGRRGVGGRSMATAARWARSIDDIGAVRRAVPGLLCSRVDAVVDG